MRSEGQFTYKLLVALSINNTVLHQSQGAVTCSTSASPQNASVGSRGFLRPRFGVAPYRTAYEDGTLFTGLGLGDCLNDQLTFLTYNETSGGQFNRTLEEYVSDYSQAGFNIFRWSNGNCAWRIELSFDGNPGRSIGNVYNATLVMLLDEVYNTFRAHGMSMWAVPFAKDNREPLFPNMGDGDTVYHLAQRQAIERHLEYVVARWGAQTDVWSLLNEQRADSAWLTVAADYVRSIDPYQHPVTSSWNDHLNLTQIEMDSVHWYYGEKFGGTTGSASAASDMIDAEMVHGKPVYFTESGNRAHNWDVDSHTRMRIRSWVCFFKSAVLMWWNTAGTRNCVPCGGGNMYLGPLERSYNSILRRYANFMLDPDVQQLDVTTMAAGINAFSIRGAAFANQSISQQTLILAYLHHNTSHSTNISTGIIFGNNVRLAGCAGLWLDPSNGTTTVIETINASGSLTSPLFTIDIALRLECPGAPSPIPPPSPPPIAPSPTAYSTRYKHWASVQGANYVPSYSTNDVKDIFRPGFWNATVVERELSFAKKLSVNSLRVFVSFGGYMSDNSTSEFLQNYVSFQRLMLAENLTLMVTLGTGERAPIGPCNETTSFVSAVVNAEVAGVVIAYEADNEPTGYMFDYLINCTLPAIFNVSRSPNVDIGVGVAHVGEVAAFKDHVTTLNWHSYNGQSNGGGLQGEINEVQKYMNKFSQPKQLIVTEWLARPAQPLASAYPVLRDSAVVGYAWALIIVDCTTHWGRPVVPGDPPFQGMIWPNGTVYDDVEEGECMRNQCKTLQYVHHCCNNPHDDGEDTDSLWNFSGSNGSDWQTKSFGSPEFKLPGPREGSMRWTNVTSSSVLIGPLPNGTARVALYLANRPNGVPYTVQLDGSQIHASSTQSNATAWVSRTLLSVKGGKLVRVSVGDTMNGTSQFSIYGVTFFSNP